MIYMKTSPRQRLHQEDADWLKSLLRYGPVGAQDVHDEAGHQGISRSRLRRAQNTLDIVPRKTGLSGKWVWELPS